MKTLQKWTYRRLSKTLLTRGIVRESRRYIVCYTKMITIKMDRMGTKNQRKELRISTESAGCWRNLQILTCLPNNKNTSYSSHIAPFGNRRFPLRSTKNSLSRISSPLLSTSNSKSRTSSTTSCNIYQNYNSLKSPVPILCLCMLFC